MLHESLAGGLSDEELIMARWVRALGSVRIETRKPRLNQLAAYASIGSGTGADSVAAQIAADQVGLSDPEQFNFMGQMLNETFGPPETALASTPNELDRMARSHFDRFGRMTRTMRLEAEWNAAIEPGDFAVLLSKNGDGTPVSYGAWRIETIGFDIRKLQQSFDTRAEYGMRFQEPYAPEGYAMVGAGWEQ